MTQGERIVKYMQDFGSITPMEAFSDLGITKLSTRIIQPYQFGDPARKATCLWLKGLPKLQPTKIVEPELIEYICTGEKKKTFSKDYCLGLGSHRGKQRSKTYPGIAKAMAEQWGDMEYTPEPVMELDMDMDGQMRLEDLV